MQILSEIQAEIVQQQRSKRAKVHDDDDPKTSNLWTHFERKIGSDGDLGAEVKVAVGVTDGEHGVARGQGLGFDTAAVVWTWSQPLWIRTSQNERRQQSKLHTPFKTEANSFVSQLKLETTAVLSVL